MLHQRAWHGLRLNVLETWLETWTCACRGRIRRSLCDFAGAEADFRAVLAVKPANTAAEKELDGATRGLQALEAARLARSVTNATRKEMNKEY